MINRDLGFAFSFIAHEMYWKSTKVYGGKMHVQYFVDTQPLIGINRIHDLY